VELGVPVGAGVGLTDITWPGSMVATSALSGGVAYPNLLPIVYQDIPPVRKTVSAAFVVIEAGYLFEKYCAVPLKERSGLTFISPVNQREELVEVQMGP
jgi:hypothetical protein